MSELCLGAYDALSMGPAICAAVQRAVVPHPASSAGQLYVLVNMCALWHGIIFAVCQDAGVHTAVISGTLGLCQ